jgi:hypothetical protein
VDEFQGFTPERWARLFVVESRGSLTNAAHHAVKLREGVTVDDELHAFWSTTVKILDEWVDIQQKAIDETGD